MPLHVDMTVGTERDALCLEQGALPAPSWSSAANGIDDTVTREPFGTWGIAQRAPHHAGVAGPTGQCCDVSVGGDISNGNLADNVEHIVTKRPRLLGSHLVGIVLHH